MAEPQADTDPTGSRPPPPRFRPVRLWLIVTALWTAATLDRLGWPSVPSSTDPAPTHRGLIWILLILPPVMFAVMIRAICMITGRDPDRRR